FRPAPAGAAAMTRALRLPGRRRRRVGTYRPSGSFQKLNTTVRIAFMEDSPPAGPALGAYVLPGRVTDPAFVVGQAQAAERLGLRTVWLSGLGWVVTKL